MSHSNTAGRSAVVRRHRWLAVLLTWVCVNASAAPCACTLHPVVIQPETPEPTDTYVGRTTSLELRFHNEKVSGSVDVFPEPPLRVKQLKNAAECTINDGGIWVRQHVYVSGSGDVLAIHEYSGSSDALVFYDTHTCDKKASIDVSNAKWRIDGGSVLLVPSKAGKRPSKVDLAPGCLPPDRH